MISHGYGYSVCGLFEIVMFPDADDFPAGVVEALVGVGVAAFVGFDFGSPEVGGGAGGGSVVLGAAVPEASVEEDGDFGSGEDEVGGAADIFDGACGDSVAQSECVNGGSKGSFGASIAAAVGAHDRAGVGGGCPRVGFAGVVVAGSGGLVALAE